MFIVTKTAVRPNVETPFFPLQLPYAKQLLIDLGIGKNDTLSEDLLTLTTVLTAPSQEVFNQLIADPIFNQHVRMAQEEYNNANGIVCTAQVA